MSSVLISFYRASQPPSIGSDILLPTRPNFLLVISTKAFEIINWDQRIETIKLDEYSYSFALKLLLICMNTMETGRVYPLQTSILFFIPITFGVGFLCDSHLWQFFKVINLKQESKNYELKN